jgi:hypothetical protein
MAAVELPNGDPASPTPSLAHKRKHSAVESDHINGVVTNGDEKHIVHISSPSAEPTAKMQDLMADLLVILERYAQWSPPMAVF